jgi:peptide/nickel transport system ATP-binding protein
LYFNNVSQGPIDISSPDRVRPLAGRSISLVPQNPFTSLNPAFRCGTQIAEMLGNNSLSADQRKSCVIETLKDLGFSEPERIYAAYPFELSGGQLQRIVIAMATIGNPELIIADEPTTALDALTQSEVIDMLVRWIRTGNKSMLLVSHDISLLQKYCDRIYVMQNGVIVRSGVAKDIAEWLDQSADIRDSSPTIEPREILCEVSGLSIRYESRGGEQVQALQNVDFQIFSGEALGLVGATGCGKSTIAKVLTGLVSPEYGNVLFKQNKLDYRAYPELRRHIQMIFQDPYSALYPHLTVAAYLREAIRLHGLAERAKEEGLIFDVLEQVGLERGFADRYPHQLSGGERQRVQIARTVLLKPSLLICDEITSGLDIAIQGQILQMLRRLHQEYHMALLIISHDLHVIKYMAQRVLVMDNGHIVEAGDVDGVFSLPKHEITRALLRVSA